MNAFFEKIKQVFQKSNLTARLICLVCAVMLWVYVASTKKGEITVRVPIEFRNIPATEVIVKKQFKSVMIVLSGKNEDIKSVDTKSIKAFVNLENAASGENLQYPIEINRAIVPDTVSVDLSQQKLLLSIEKREYKKVIVIPETSGKPRNGYALGTIKILPEYVTVSGAASQLRKIDAVYTKKIHVNTILKRMSVEVALNIESMNDITVDTPKVTAGITVFDTAGLLKVKIQPRIRSISDRYNYSLMDSSITVYLKPSQDGVEVLNDDLEAFVDVVVPETGFLLVENEDSLEKNMPVILTFKNRMKRDMLRTIQIVPDSVPVKITKK